MILGLSPEDDGKPVVTIKLTERQAEWISDGMSDFLCWAAGFEAALGENEISRAPMGTSQIREFRIHLMKQIEAAA